MIEDYRRPNNLAEALEILKSPEMRFIPMGGGTAIDRYSSEPFGVLDLQGLGLNTISESGNTHKFGATVPLQSLLDTAGMQPALKHAVRIEASYNIRQVATVAGKLVSANGRSPFGTAMLALDAVLTVQPGDVQIPLGNLFALRQEILSGRIITSISIPVNARLAFSSVGRTPADIPLVCAAVTRWPSGRTRAALGGWGAAPILVMDGPDSGGLEMAARAAYSQAQDEWASAEYRQEVAEILVKRCLAMIDTG
jgi:CO/xanthine dehydrogenase FAD-binding subunit